MIPTVKAFFDQPTFTVSYVVSDPATRRAAVIDSVLNYDAASGRTSSIGADAIAAYVDSEKLTVDWVIETHVHADHLSAAPYLKSRLGGQIAIGSSVSKIQQVFGTVFNIEGALSRTGAEFDHLFEDGETFQIGDITCTALHTPGHTPACMSYLIGDAVFVGDTLFMPDFGTARCDFPGGDAAMLYHSIQKLFALPDETRMYLCHDYKAPGRDSFAWETTVGEQKRSNIHVGGGKAEADFVAARTARDAELSMPALILPSVQVNVRAGELPEPEDNGVRYLKIPLDNV